MTYAGDKEVENVINARDRHCRVGKVTEKRSRSVPDWRGPYREWWKEPFPIYPPELQGAPVRKCSCRPGQACGNAACPHGIFATSGAGYVNPKAVWLS